MHSLQIMDSCPIKDEYFSIEEHMGERLSTPLEGTARSFEATTSKKTKSDNQIQVKREKQREYSRRNRLKKKMLIKSDSITLAQLTEQVATLRQELKVVQSELIVQKAKNVKIERKIETMQLELSTVIFCNDKSNIS